MIFSKDGNFINEVSFNTDKMKSNTTKTTVESGSDSER